MYTGPGLPYTPRMRAHHFDLLILLAAGATTGAAVAVLGFADVGDTSTASVDLLVALDKDEDGVVTGAEYRAASDGRVAFTTVDIDQDGTFSAWEAEQVLQFLSPLQEDRLGWVR